MVFSAPPYVCTETGELKQQGSQEPVMVELPALDKIDIATLLLVVGLLFLGYVVYPTQLIQASVLIAIIMLFVCWSGYFFYKLVYDDVHFWD